LLATGHCVVCCKGSASTVEELKSTLVATVIKNAIGR